MRDVSANQNSDGQNCGRIFGFKSANRKFWEPNVQIKKFPHDPDVVLAALGHEDIEYMLLTSVCASVETESFVDGVCLPYRLRPGKNLANIRYIQLDSWKHGKIDYFPTQLLNNYGGFQPRLQNIGNS